MQGTEIAARPELGESFIQDPYTLYDELRRQGPAREVIMPQGTKVWLITGYEHARAALADPRLSKEIGVTAELFQRHNSNGANGAFAGSALAAHMLNADPPDHTRLRKLVNKAFTSRGIERMRGRVEQITAELIAEMSTKDSDDLLSAFAFPLPITVICELLGVPLSDRDDFREWSTTLVSVPEPDRVQAAVVAMAEYLTKLVDSKRREPGEDLLTDLVQASDNDDRLAPDELVSMAFLLLVAGHETTVNLIGNGVLALLNHPEQLAALRADRSLLHGAIEEFLRYEGPVNLATFRHTLEPITIGEVEIPAKEFVMVSLLSANRDESHFPNADQLDVTRKAGGHLAFGHGIHYCVGAPLARLEAEIAIDALLDRFPDLSLAVPPAELRWRHSTLMRGLETLPVKLR